MRVALIDSDYLCYRSVFTTNSLSHGSIGTGVIFGFLQQLLTVGKAIKPDVYVFCWDSRKSLRKKEYPFYKEKRDKSDLSDEEREAWREAYKQFNMIRHRILPQMGFSNQILQQGYESDDLLAQILHNYVFEDSIIVSSDDDLLQLLDLCRLYNVKREKVITREDFIDEYGIEPAQWVEVKKIAGCTSDNVPGVKGVGVKKAISFLRKEMKSNSVIYKRIKDESSKAIIDRNDWLVRLPLPGTPPQSLRFDDAFDEKQFKEVCKRYGIKSFLKPSKYDEWIACFS